MSKPLARTDELVIEQAADELLIYDQRTDQAHCLTPTAVDVWRSCDGATTADEMAGRLGIDLDEVSRGLDQLAQCELLEAWQPAGVTRREATMRLAKVGAAAAAAPLIYSLAAPRPALATSQATCLSQGCSTTGCGFCHQGTISCCCCGPSNGAQKFCVAACDAANCFNILATGMNPCNVTSTGHVCNGPGC